MKKKSRRGFFFVRCHLTPLPAIFCFFWSGTRLETVFFILGGSSRSSDNDVAINKGQNDAWIIKVDSNGNIIWERTVGGSNIDFAYDITQLNDGSIIVTGDSTSNDGDILLNQGFTDLLLLKIED